MCWAMKYIVNLTCVGLRPTLNEIVGKGDKAQYYGSQQFRSNEEDY